MEKISGIPRVGRLDRENRPGKGGEELLGFKQIFFRNIFIKSQIEAIIGFAKVKITTKESAK
jgi:hypothetical protein